MIHGMNIMQQEVISTLTTLQQLHNNLDGKISIATKDFDICCLGADNIRSKTYIRDTQYQI
jgi:5'-3' exonuclease